MSNPEKDLRQILINDGIVLPNQVVLGERTENFQGDFQLVVRLVTGNMNPKWMLDDLSFTFILIGKDRNSKPIVADKIWEIHNHLLGGPNKQIGDSVYLQFNSQTVPRDVGTTADGKPSYASTMLIYRQVQTAQPGSNRLPLSG